MRTWELDDGRLLPSDLVREQDFILRLRRLQRLEQPHQVINFVLTATRPGEGGRLGLEAAKEALQAWGKNKGAYVTDMSNGDLFVVRPDHGDCAGLAEEAFSILWPEGLSDEKKATVYSAFKMPMDYALLRERLNTYIEISRRAAEEMEGTSASLLLNSEAARGPLTNWSASQVEKLLDEIDVYRYVQKQPVCERLSDGSWYPLFEEYFIGFEALRVERFPHLEISANSPLFQNLCLALDHTLLKALSEEPERIAHRRLFLNLSVTSVTGNYFARFARCIPEVERSNVGFKLNRGDLFQDLPATLNALAVLRQESFRVAIDGLTPLMLPYINLNLFNVDYLKLNVSSYNAGQLHDPLVRATLETLPTQKIIFSRCDSDVALKVGLDLGVTKYQGWLIDDYLRSAAAPSKN